MTDTKELFQVELPDAKLVGSVTPDKMKLFIELRAHQDQKKPNTLNEKAILDQALEALGPHTKVDRVNLGVVRDLISEFKEKGESRARRIVKGQLPGAGRQLGSLRTRCLPARSGRGSEPPGPTGAGERAVAPQGGARPSHGSLGHLQLEAHQPRLDDVAGGARGAGSNRLLRD